MTGVSFNICISGQRFLSSSHGRTLTTKSLPVTSDDQVKAYIKKIMSQLSKWTVGGKISKLVIVITSKETGENVERWQFDVSPVPEIIVLAGMVLTSLSRYKSSTKVRKAANPANEKVGMKRILRPLR